MSGMTSEQIKEHREALEQRIRDDLVRFQKETGARHVSLTLDQMPTTQLGEASSSTIHSVEISAEL